MLSASAYICRDKTQVMNSQEYIEVSIRIEPYSDENAEILMAELEELPFESFESENPYLKYNRLGRELTNDENSFTISPVLEG